MFCNGFITVHSNNLTGQLSEKQDKSKDSEFKIEITIFHD